MRAWTMGSVRTTWWRGTYLCRRERHRSCQWVPPGRPRPVPVPRHPCRGCCEGTSHPPPRTKIRSRRSYDWLTLRHAGSRITSEEPELENVKSNKQAHRSVANSSISVPTVLLWGISQSSKRAQMDWKQNNCKQFCVARTVFETVSVMRAYQLFADENYIISK